jgi:putative membrane protein
MRVLSIVWAFLQFHGFQLAGRGDDLRAEHGLLTRVSKTIPRHRIQVVSAREGALHRLSGRVSLLARTAGGAAPEAGGGRGRLWLAPLIEKRELPALLADVLPALELGDPPWQGIAARAWRRVFKRSLVPVVLVAAAGGSFLTPWLCAVAAPLAGLAYLHARLHVRHAAYALVPGALLYRSGWWMRRFSVVRFSKIQSVAWHESPFDRRNAMATLAVDTAGGSWGHGLAIEYLDAPVARALLEQLSAEAGRTAFRW